MKLVEEKFDYKKEIEKALKATEKNEESKLISILDNLYYQYDEHSAEEHYGAEIYSASKEELQKEIEKIKKMLQTRKEIDKNISGKYQIKKDWDESFNNHIFEQPEYSSFFFHFVMGGLFFHDFRISYNQVKDDDIRVHIGIIGPTGIGKTESNNYCIKLVKEIPKRKYTKASGEEVTEYFEAEVAGKSTDAGLIGSLETDLYVKQIEQGIKPFITRNGETVPNPRYIDPIQKGSFWKDDFLVIDEAEQVFKQNKDSEQLQLTFRRAMNRYGDAGQELSNNAIKCRGLVKFNSTTSISMTSYFIKEFNTTYFQGGLMQRMLLFIDYEDREKRKKIAERIKDSMINFIDNDENESEQQLYKRINEIFEKNKEFAEKRIQLRERVKQKIIERKLKYMTYKEAKWNPNDRKQLLLSPSVVNRAEELIDEVLSIPLTISQQEQLETQRTRLLPILIKCASHYAILEDDREVYINDKLFGIKIAVEDVEMAFKTVIIPQSNSVSDFLKMNLKTTDVDKNFEEFKRKLIKCLKKVPQGMSKTELNKLLCKPENWGMSESWNITMLKKMEERGIIGVVKTGNKNERLVKLINRKEERPNWL